MCVFIPYCSCRNCDPFNVWYVLAFLQNNEDGECSDFKSAMNKISNLAVTNVMKLPQPVFVQKNECYLNRNLILNNFVS